MLRHNNCARDDCSSTVKGQISRFWCWPKSEGPCWLFPAPLGPDASCHIGDWDVPLDRQEKRPKPGNTTRSDQPFSNEHNSTLPGAEKHLWANGCCCWAVLGPHRGDTVALWGSNGDTSWPMSQPGGRRAGPPGRVLHLSFIRTSEHTQVLIRTVQQHSRKTSTEVIDILSCVCSSLPFPRGCSRPPRCGAGRPAGSSGLGRADRARW